MNKLKRILLASLCPFILAQPEMSYAYGIAGVSAIYENQFENHPTLSYKVAANSGYLGAFINPLAIFVPPTLGGSVVKKFYNKNKTWNVFVGPAVLVGLPMTYHQNPNPFIIPDIELGFEMRTRSGSAVQFQLSGSTPFSLVYKTRLDPDL